MLSTDADSPNTEVIYEVLSNSSGGGSYLEVGGTPMGIGDTFTQADVAQSFNTRFRNVDGNSGPVQITMEVRDADGNVSPDSPATITFNVL